MKVQKELHEQLNHHVEEQNRRHREQMVSDGADVKGGDLIFLGGTHGRVSTATGKSCCCRHGWSINIFRTHAVPEASNSSKTRGR